MSVGSVLQKSYPNVDVVAVVVDVVGWWWWWQWLWWWWPCFFYLKTHCIELKINGTARMNGKSECDWDRERERERVSEWKLLKMNKNWNGLKLHLDWDTGSPPGGFTSSPFHWNNFGNLVIYRFGSLTGGGNDDDDDDGSMIHTLMVLPLVPLENLFAFYVPSICILFRLLNAKYVSFYLFNLMVSFQILF